MSRRAYQTPGTGDAVFHIPDPILKDGFGRIPVAAMRLAELSPSAKYVYACLLYYAWKLEYFPGQMALSREFHVPRRSLQRHLEELEESGLIRRLAPRRTGEVSVIRLNPPRDWCVPDRPMECAKTAKDGAPNWPAEEANAAQPRIAPDWPTTKIDSNQEEGKHLSIPKHTLAAVIGWARGLVERGHGEEALRQFLEARGMEGEVAEHVVAQVIKR
jgi:DNA-binding transcriptional ArsR family regulator